MRFSAVQTAGTEHLVHASSVGAYAPAPDKPFVNEEWPTRPIAGSSYSRHKVLVEADLDALEKALPQLVLTRVRPGLVLQGDAARAITRYFIGPAGGALPVVRRLRLPLAPLPRGLLVPVVHADDLASGIVTVLERRLHGGVNFAADAPVSGADLAAAMGTRLWEVPPAMVRRVVQLSWAARLQPTDVGWFDLAMGVPLLDTERARRELDWRPRRTATEALQELLAGMATRRGAPSPVLEGRADGPSGGTGPAGPG